MKIWAQNGVRTQGQVYNRYPSFQASTLELCSKGVASGPKKGQREAAS